MVSERVDERTRTDTGVDIELVVNGVARTAPPGSTVRDLIEALGLVPETIVVELNLEILDRSAYGEIELRSGDRLELVHFVGGG